MRFKLIIVLAEPKWTDPLTKAAREAGATGVTVISNAHGEGIELSKSLFGLPMGNHSDIMLLLVEEHMSRCIMEALEATGHMRDKGTGIAFQVDVEDAVGVSHQIDTLSPLVDEMI